MSRGFCFSAGQIASETAVRLRSAPSDISRGPWTGSISAQSVISDRKNERLRRDELATKPIVFGDD